MLHEPVTLIVPSRMGDMRKRVTRKFNKLEKQVKTRERVTWKVLNDFFERTHKDWKIQNQSVDQHTGGEEFVERWWSDYFEPRFIALEDAKQAQGKRLARRRKR